MMQQPEEEDKKDKDDENGNGDGEITEKRKAIICCSANDFYGSEEEDFNNGIDSHLNNSFLYQFEERS